MKIRISDLADRCCPESVVLGGGDAALCERLDRSVLERIGAEKSRRRTKLPKALLLAAVLVLLLGTAAFAASDYFMDRRQVQPAEPPVTGRWLLLSDSGEVLEEQKLVFPEAGMVLSFSGPEEERTLPEFRCFWLPSEADRGLTDAEGWTRYLADEGGGEEIPYILRADAVEPGKTRLVLSGTVETVKETQWGDWQLIELSSDYSGIPYWGYDRANYILLFNARRGWLVQISGMLELETLEHIAREMEIRDSGEAAVGSAYREQLGSMDLGRG